MEQRIYLTALMLLIAGCSQQDDRICQTPPNLIATKNGSHCIHRNAYLMADADGSISDIAKAVAQKCSSHTLDDSMTATARAGAGAQASGNADETYEWYQQEALREAFQRVTEARSGNCDKPDE